MEQHAVAIDSCVSRIQPEPHARASVLDAAQQAVAIRCLEDCFANPVRTVSSLIAVGSGDFLILFLMAPVRVH